MLAKPDALNAKLLNNGSVGSMCAAYLLPQWKKFTAAPKDWNCNAKLNKAPFQSLGF